MNAAMRSARKKYLVCQERSLHGTGRIVCISCHRRLSRAAFYEGHDGNVCKECRRAYSREYSRKRRAEGRLQKQEGGLS